LAADCGWSVTKALSSVHPAVAVATPTAAATTQHCVVSSATSCVSSVSQHSAVMQQSDVAIDRDASAAARHADTKIINTEPG